MSKRSTKKNALENYRKKGPGRKHREGEPRGRNRLGNAPDKMTSRLWAGADESRTKQPRKGSTYRGYRRNTFFGRVPVGNTNPDNRFTARGGAS